MQLKVFKYIGLAGALVSVGLMGTATSVLSLPGSQYINTYYADARMQEIVGVSYLICNGNHANKGEVTPYVETQEESCDMPGGGGTGIMCDGPTVDDPYGYDCFFTE